MRRGVNRRQMLQSTAVAVAGVGFYSSLKAAESTSPNEKSASPVSASAAKGHRIRPTPRRTATLSRSATSTTAA